MPIIELKLSGQEDPALAKELAKEISCLTKDVPGTVHPVSYPAMQEMKADAYGDEGLTIEHQYIHNQKIQSA